MGNDVFNYLNYFIYKKNISNNENVISKNNNKQSLFKLENRSNNNNENEISEANHIKSNKINNNSNSNLNINSKVNNNNNNLNLNNNNNNLNNNVNINNLISKNINHLYSNWKPVNKIKIQNNNEINEIQNNLSLKELRNLNNEASTNYDEKINNNLKFIVKNYLDQKEFLKTVLDLNLIKRILFDDSQSLKFEELSRDMNFMLEILREKEVISYEVLCANSKKKDKDQNLN